MCCNRIKKLSRQIDHSKVKCGNDVKMASLRLLGKYSEVYCGSIQLLRLSQLGLHTSENIQPQSSSLLAASPTSSLSTSSPKSKLVEEIQTEKVPRVHPQLQTALYMDTHTIVKGLQKAGFSLEQSEALVTLITESQQKSLIPLTTSFVTDQDLEVLKLRIQNDLDSVRGSQVLIEKSLVQSLQNDNETLNKQVQNLLSNFKDEVSKVQSGLQLDLNLEKSRIKEESRNLEEKIKDNHNRIDREVAQLRTQMETLKLESIKYLVGGIFSIATIVLSVILGLWRLLK